MTAESIKEFVDPLLHKAIRWLTNKDLFSRAADVAGNDNLKCFSIASDIMALSSNIHSQKLLGLAVYLHHEYGNTCANPLTNSYFHINFYTCSFIILMSTVSFMFGNF